MYVTKKENKGKISDRRRKDQISWQIRRRLFFLSPSSFLPLQNQERLLIKSLHLAFFTNFVLPITLGFCLLPYRFPSVSPSHTPELFNSWGLVKVRTGANLSPLTGQSDRLCWDNKLLHRPCERMPMLVWLIYRRSFRGLNSSKSFLPYLFALLSTRKGCYDLIARAILDTTFHWLDNDDLWSR